MSKRWYSKDNRRIIYANGVFNRMNLLTITVDEVCMGASLQNKIKHPHTILWKYERIHARRHSWSRDSSFGQSYLHFVTIGDQYPWALQSMGYTLPTLRNTVSLSFGQQWWPKCCDFSWETTFHHFTSNTDLTAMKPKLKRFMTVGDIPAFVLFDFWKNSFTSAVFSQELKFAVLTHKRCLHL